MTEKIDIYITLCTEQDGEDTHRIQGQYKNKTLIYEPGQTPTTETVLRPPVFLGGNLIPQGSL